jgi:uncharacterized protein (TIGR02284 family)
VSVEPDASKAGGADEAAFAADLQAEVRRMAEDPAECGPVMAALHRGWMDIKADVTGRDEGAIISECERGEDIAVRQFLQVKAAHDQIRALERARSRHV